MKNVWKWLISIVLVLCGGSLILLVKVYGDIKSTADEIYTPIGERVPDIRTEPVDITVKKSQFPLLY